MVDSPQGAKVPASPLPSVKALVFDTFGTVVDWRSSVAKEIEDLAARKGFTVDGAKFADAWRGGYGPSMNSVRTGELPWTRLDDLHRMILDRILVEFKITGLSRQRDRCTQSRVASAAAVAGCGRWADTVEEEVHDRAAVERQHRLDDGDGETFRIAVGLHSRRRTACATTSRIARSTLSAAEFLDLEPAEVMMVAAHLGDLRAAKALGLKTAFVVRPLEYGPKASLT